MCLLPLVQFHEAMHAVDACAGLSDADIARAIRQATGPRTPLFVPEGSFEVLARQQIKLLRTHCLNAVELVLAEMQRLLPACLPPAVLRYAALQARMQQCGHSALQRRERKASEMVNNLIDIELAYLNTSHPDFVGGGTAMRLVAQQLHAAADEQQYRAELETTQQPVAPPGRGTPPVAMVAARPAPYEQAEASRPAPAVASDPLGATGGDGNDTFLHQFFGTGTVSRAQNPFSAPQQPPPLPPPPPPPPPPPNQYYGGQNASVARGQAVSSSVSRDRTTQNREQLETDIIRSLLVSYYGIVRKNLLDSVPKAIMHFLVNSVRANIQEELVIELYREDEFADMLREADDAVRRRADCVKLVSTLERAQREVDELRAMPIEGALLDSLIIS